MCTYDYGALPLFLSRVLQATPPLLELYACGSGLVDNARHALKKQPLRPSREAMNLGACPSWPLFNLAKAAADRVKGIAANAAPRLEFGTHTKWHLCFVCLRPASDFRGGKHSTSTKVVATAKVKWESVE